LRPASGDASSGWAPMATAEATNDSINWRLLMVRLYSLTSVVFDACDCD
jgi:hypothetical protein